MRFKWLYKELRFPIYVLVVICLLHYLRMGKTSDREPPIVSKDLSDPSHGKITAIAGLQPIESNRSSSDSEALPDPWAELKKQSWKKLSRGELRKFPTWRSHFEYYCQKLGYSKQLFQPDLIRNLIVNDQHKFIFCGVAKVASTNWKRILMFLTGKMNVSSPMDIPSSKVHILAWEKLRYLKQYSPEEIRYRLKNYFKFLISRNPYERLLSAYLNKVGNVNNKYYSRRYGEMIAKRYRSKTHRDTAPKNGSKISFSEFLQYVADPTLPDPTDPHWIRVSDTCHPCMVVYDFVGYTDTLETDSEYVLKKVRAPPKLHFPRRSATYRGVRTDNILTQYYKEVSPALRDQIYMRYYSDFLLFNHTVPKDL